jgi:hypothetical protein
VAVHDVLAEFLLDVGMASKREGLPYVLDGRGAAEKSLNSGVRHGDLGQISGELDI